MRQPRCSPSDGRVGGYEKGESQTFWIELLTDVFSLEEPSVYIRFKQQENIKQSDGSLLTLFMRTHRLNDHLVMQIYGFPAKMTESECVAALFRRYGEMME